MSTKERNILLEFHTRRLCPSSSASGSASDISAAAASDFKSAIF